MLSGDTQAAQGQDGAFNQMLRRFATHWDRIDVICPPVRGAVSVIHQHVFFHPSPYPKLLQPVFIRQKGIELLKQRDYAAMTSHDYGFFINGLGAWWLADRVRWISEIHHIEGYPRAANNKERLYRWLAKQYLKIIWRSTAGIRVVNHVEMPSLLHQLGIPAEKIRVLPSLYMDFDIFHPMPGEPKKYDVLFVGRLASNKGLPMLLEAIAQVKATHPTIRLGILGQGKLSSQLEERIQTLKLSDHVHFIPRAETTADLASIYNQAKMLVCASTSEGGPRVTVEAMACGIPVISTPVGVMQELAESVLLFEWDVQQLTHHLRTLLDDAELRQALGKKGQTTVQQFEADQIIRQYAEGIR